MRRSLILAFTLALLTGGLVLVGASSASAASIGPACVFNVGYTVKSGTTIWGSGSMSCSSPGQARLQVSVQEYYLGSWRTRHSEVRSCSYCTPGGSAWNFSSGASCAGHGRDSWRTRVYANWYGGLPARGYSAYLTSNTITVTC
jgi:hypothetical protein